MGMWHINPEMWRCDKHHSEKTMVRQGDEWIMICIKCEEEKMQDEVHKENNGVCQR